MNIADLHLCNKSMSNSGIDDCECPPEYFCAAICTEEYEDSTRISWQHFPRSTSSRSFCDSTETEIKSLSDTPPPIQEPEPLPSEQLSSTEYPITKSFSQLNALHYLEIRHIFKLLDFMIGHLVCNEPDDPVEYLEDLLGQCLKFRDSFGEPPLLFTTSHIQSLYKAFDPFERGSITLEQYKGALDTMGLKNGITKYNEDPPLNEDGSVGEQYFMFEAERCLVDNLKAMLRIPTLAEENRLKYIKILQEAREKERRKTIESPKEAIKENAEIDSMKDKLCHCFGSRPKSDLICRCAPPTNLHTEPEQLYFDK